MSSLLDVLHKRPARSRLTAAGDTQALAAPVPQPGEPATISLAPELELAPPVEGLASPTLVDEPAAAKSGRSPEPLPVDGGTTGLRRWSDAIEAAGASTSAAPTRPAPAPVPRPVRRRPQPVLLALFAAVVAFGAFLAWQFAGQEDETLFAVPLASAPVAPVADPQPPAPAPMPKKARRSPAAAPVASPADAGEELPWYDQPALAETAAAEPASPAIEITRGSGTDPRHEQLSAAYAALLAGEDAQAEAIYRQVLAGDPGGVDALLGLGALAARGGRDEEARAYFRQVQRLEPKNATAAAALSALPGGADATGAESQLKTLLREQPAAAALHFALGVHYVAAGRWTDAQLAFFEAVRHEPTNPDYAFNLAVSLDRLGQAQPAASYYRRALDLAGGGQRFDTGAAQARLAALQAPAD